LDYACRGCGRVFNAFTATALAKRQLSPAQALLFLRGVAQGVSTAQLSRELGRARSCLLDLRHKLQAHAEAALDRSRLPDAIVEADQMYQNAGKKGVKHAHPSDPPRRRANQLRGHGTLEKDRPPILGVVGRESGQVRLAVIAHAEGATLCPLVEGWSRPEARVHTDAWLGVPPPVPHALPSRAPAAGV
jgi:hypothetical protein